MADKDKKDSNWKNKRLWGLGWKPVENDEKETLTTTEFAKLQNIPDEKKIPREEASQKGRDILSLMADLYQLIEWEDDEESGDPYLKMTYYKSGKFTIETYKDSEVSEFTIDEIISK